MLCPSFLPLARRVATPLCAALLLGLACSESGTKPVRAAQVVVSLSTSATTLGAVQLLIRPPAGASADLSGLTVPPAYSLYQRPVAGGVRVIVIGPLQSGEVIRFAIPDAEQAEGYTITKEAGADGITFATITAAEFALRVAVVGAVP